MQTDGALRRLATGVEAAEIVKAFDEALMDFAGSEDTFGYGGGRDLGKLAEDAAAGSAR